MYIFYGYKNPINDMPETQKQALESIGFSFDDEHVYYKLPIDIKGTYDMYQFEQLIKLVESMPKKYFLTIPKDLDFTTNEEEDLAGNKKCTVYYKNRAVIRLEIGDNEMSFKVNEKNIYKAKNSETALVSKYSKNFISDLHKTMILEVTDEEMANSAFGKSKSHSML